MNHVGCWNTSLPATAIRVVIEQVKPEVDGGRFPIKRVEGEKVQVTAKIYADGHDLLQAVLQYKPGGKNVWEEVPLNPEGQDIWSGSFRVTEIGCYLYTIEAWIDHFGSWFRDFQKKVEAQQDVDVDLLVGIQLIDEAAKRATGKEATDLASFASDLRLKYKKDRTGAVQLALDPQMAALVRRHPDRHFATRHSKDFVVIVDREKARFSTWYELFPRSSSPQPGRHGTLRDCEARLPYVANMGFDVLYLPPIHPVGLVRRKGKNNNPVSNPDDVGSPWAIGSEEGGHDAVYSELGTLEDFRRLVQKAHDFGLEVALDIAFQCAPDHPWVKQHPGWFRWRPDGTVQYAENPPKKYEDILPLNFETSEWKLLWQELERVMRFWIDQGVRIFRVDNPHTKAFPFWEWVIGEIKNDFPDVIFLAEAFTRPTVMYHLAKLGFTQSYTYFAWRNTKWELTEYFTELTKTDLREYFRPNLWPNTPDILTEYLQFGGRPAFMARLVLAATLGASYGIYGPAFELCENQPREPGSEEYLNAEKYEIRQWDLARADSLSGLIARVNEIRKQNPPLQSNDTLLFHSLDNDQLIGYSKTSEDLSQIILVVVNLDSFHTQSGWINLPLEALGIDPGQSFQVHDLLSQARYWWQGPRNYIELNPHICPAHIFRVRKRIHTERDFDYFL